MFETEDMLAFTRVIELESLTRAAHALGVPKSTISRRLTRLEGELGAQLLRRTTHGIVATEQGTTFFEYASRCLGLMRDGANAVQAQHVQPRGLLRLAVPPELDRGLLAPVIAAYLARHPEVRLVTAVSGGASDPFRAGFDLAIVADALPQAEASLVTTKLGSVATALYAARDYVEKSGLPQSHVDLARFDLIAWGSADVRAHWVLTHAESTATVEFRPRLVCDDALLLRQAVLAGLGVAILPVRDCAGDVAAGRLVPVLSDWRPPPRAFYAVFPKAQAMPVRVRALIDVLVERLRPVLLDRSGYVGTSSVNGGT